MNTVQAYMRVLNPKEIWKSLSQAQRLVLVAAVVALLQMTILYLVPEPLVFASVIIWTTIHFCLTLLLLDR